MKRNRDYTKKNNKDKTLQEMIEKLKDPPESWGELITSYTFSPPINMKTGDILKVTWTMEFK